jgi:hypothetical protein
MYLAGGQLFSGPDLKTFLADRLNALDAAVMALGAADFAAQSEAALESALASRFRVPDAHLRAEDSYFVGEREMTVAEAGLPVEGLPSEGGQPYPPDAMLKSVTIAIPFQGHPALFTHRPNVFSAHQPEATLVGQELHIGFIVAPEEEWMIQHRFQQHIALIERTLEVTQWQAMDFNAELPGQIRARLRARKAAVGASL